MALVTRKVANTGQPLYSPSGQLLTNVAITFLLVTPYEKRTDVWDTESGERVVGLTKVTTDGAGIFSVDLWPTDRGNIVTQYLCHVDAPGVKDFRASLPSDDLSTMRWIDLMAQGAPLLPQELNVLQQYLGSMQVLAQGVAEDAEHTLTAREAVDAVGEQVGEDRVQTGHDREQTAADRLATGQDRDVVHGDRQVVEGIAGQVGNLGTAVAQASDARDLAQQWAVKPAGEVVEGQGFSAKKYAADAGQQAELANTNGQAQVALALAQAVAAYNSAVAAGQSQAQAAQAASAALIQAGVYASVAAGNAAVADGVAFKTQGDLYRYAAFEWRRTSSDPATATLVATYPGGQFLIDVAEAAPGMRKLLGVTDKFPVVTDMNFGVLLGGSMLTGDPYGLFVDRLVAKMQAPADALKELYAPNAQGLALYNKTADDIQPILTDVNYGILRGVRKSTGAQVGLWASAAQSATYSGLTPLAAALKPILKDWNGSKPYGQSLSVATRGTPIISTTQPSANRTFAGGPKAAAGQTTSKLLIEDTGGSGGAAPQSAPNDQGETICSAMCNSAVERAAIENGIDPATLVFFASAPGQGSTGIADLSKGSTVYTRAMGHVTAAKSIATAAGKSYGIHAWDWIQGEYNVNAGTTRAAYSAAMVQLAVDLDADSRAITGQASPVHMLTYQTAFRAATGGAVQLAQLDAVAASPLIHFVTPIYHMPHADDNVHLTAIGYYWVGKYFGRALKQLVVDGAVPDCLFPLSATARGQTLTVKMRVPYKPLVLDTALLAATTDKGFKVIDATGTLTITGMSVDGDSVVMLLNRALAGTPKVRYALDYAGAGITITNGATGNLRDSCPDTFTLAGVTRPLFHASPAFELAIINLETP